MLQRCSPGLLARLRSCSVTLFAGIYSRENQSNRRKNYRHLFRQLAAISAFRFVSGPVTIDAREHLQEERRVETEKLKAAAADRGDFSELLELADKENTELRRQTENLREENASLKASLELAQENFHAIRQTQADEEIVTVGVALEEPGIEPQ